MMVPIRNRVATIAFLSTFLWLLIPNLKASPAVLWPSVLAVGLALGSLSGTAGGLVFVPHAADAG